MLSGNEPSSLHFAAPGNGKENKKKWFCAPCPPSAVLLRRTDAFWWPSSLRFSGLSRLKSSRLRTRGVQFFNLLFYHFNGYGFEADVRGHDATVETGPMGTNIVLDDEVQVVIGRKPLGKIRAKNANDPFAERGGGMRDAGVIANHVINGAHNAEEFRQAARAIIQGPGHPFAGKRRFLRVDDDQRNPVAHESLLDQRAEPFNRPAASGHPGARVQQPDLLPLRPCRLQPFGNIWRQEGFRSRKPGKGGAPL